jgi:hypothetical protein
MPSWRVLRTSDKWLTHSDLYSLKEEKYFEVDAEIVRVEQGEANNPGSTTVKKLPAMFLKSLRNGNMLPKPLGLNATNGDTIENIAGTDDYKRWPGTLVTLFVMPNVRMGRATRPAIRIKPQPPKPPAGWKPSAPTPNTNPPPPRGEERAADKARIEQMEAEHDAESAKSKAFIEKVIGRSLDGNEQLTAEEVAKVQEAMRAQASPAPAGDKPFTEEEKRELARQEAEEHARRK